MDNFDLTIIKSLYEDKIITNVAKNLFISQPALTKRLVKLEEEFGAILFIRTKKGVTFTESGLLLYDYVIRTLENQEQLKRKINNINNKHYILKIGSSNAFALQELPLLLSSFCESNNNIEFVINSKTSYEIYKDLTNNLINIAFLRDDFIWDGKKIKLAEEPVFLAYNKKINYNDLSSIPLITYEASPSIDNMMYRWLNENGVSKETAVIKANNTMVALKMLEKGVGWTIMPLLYLQDFNGYMEELTIDNKKYTRSTYLYYTNDCKNDIIKSKFIDFIKKYYNVNN